MFRKIPILFALGLALVGDRIAAIGSGLGPAETEIDASGLAVAPGFINVLSWANVTLIEDGRSASDIRQGVTLEVTGEGWSMRPAVAWQSCAMDAPEPSSSEVGYPADPREDAVD